jgi:predicted transposase/invertase (TIGR01784 family)
MSDESIHNPHDQLFKEAFSRHETAVAFFESYLPAEIGSRLDWKSLQLQPGTYTDEALRGCESDLLYAVQIDQHPILLYCLFEHQSTPDAWMPLRLLRYILAIWEQYRKQNPAADKLPPVLPLVLYQGGTTWTADLSLSGLISIPDGLAPYQPDFRHLLVDLTHIDADALQGTLIGKAVLLTLKASRYGLHNELPRILQLLAEVMQQDSSLSMIRSLLLYICTVDNDTDFTEYVKQVKATRQPKLQEEIMTIAEQLRKEGRQQGVQQGMQQGMQEALRADVLEILELRFHSVSFSIKQQLADISDAATLRRLHRLAVQAETIDAFTNGL